MVLKDIFLDFTSKRNPKKPTQIRVKEKLIKVVFVMYIKTWTPIIFAYYLQLIINNFYLLCTCSKYDWCVFIFLYTLKQNGIWRGYTLFAAVGVSPILLDLELDKSRYLFLRVWCFSSCDFASTFKFFEQINLENPEKVINRISCFTDILPRLYMLRNTKRSDWKTKLKKVSFL